MSTLPAPKYYVEGGIYTNCECDELIPGTEEKYGPYETEAEANIKWMEIARFKVDNACHRVHVVTVFDLDEPKATKVAA